MLVITNFCSIFRFLRDLLIFAIFSPPYFGKSCIFSSILGKNHGYKSMILDALFMEFGILRGSILKKIKVRKKPSFYPPKTPYLEWFSATFGDSGGSFKKNYYAIWGIFIFSIQILLIFEGHFWKYIFMFYTILIFQWQIMARLWCEIFRISELLLFLRTS